jgi:hypothetical protein
MSIFVTVGFGERVNLFNGWKIVVTNNSDTIFASSDPDDFNLLIENTDKGVYQVPVPLVNKPTIEAPYDPLGDAPVQIVAATYQLIDDEGQIVADGNFSATYPELEYNLNTNTDRYNPGEEVTLTVERKLLDFLGFRPFALPKDDDWKIEIRDFDANVVLNDTNFDSNDGGQTFTFNIPQDFEGLFETRLLSKDDELMSRVYFSVEEAESNLIFLEKESYQANDKIFVYVRNDEGNNVYLNPDNHIEIFSLDPDPARVATTEQVLVDVDTTLIKEQNDVSYLTELNGVSGRYLAQIVTEADDGGTRVLSVDTFTILAANGDAELDAGDEDGAIDADVDADEEVEAEVDANVEVDGPEVDGNVEANVDAGGGGNGGGPNGSQAPGFGDEADNEEGVGPAEGFVNRFLEVTDRRNCSDIADGYWAEPILLEMVKDQIFPVEIDDEDEVLCRPTRKVTRKEFTAWLLAVYRPELLEDIEDFDFDFDDSPLKDINGEDPFDKYIIIAFQNDIINGYPDGYFRPNRLINRAEVLKILSLSSGIFTDSEEERAALDDEFAPIKLYTDITKTDQYFYYFLQFAASTYSSDLDTYLINGRQVEVDGRTSFRAAMEEPILFSEAAKIVFISKRMKEQRERKFILQ